MPEKGKGKGKGKGKKRKKAAQKECGKANIVEECSQNKELWSGNLVDMMV